MTMTDQHLPQRRGSPDEPEPAPGSTVPYQRAAQRADRRLIAVLGALVTLAAVLVATLPPDPPPDPAVFQVADTAAGIQIGGAGEPLAVSERFALTAISGATDVTFGQLTRDDGSAQALLRIDSEQAPTEFRFVGAIDETGAAEIMTDGSVIVTDPATGETVTAIAAPWAYDANGQPVATAFAVEGDTLVQTVDHGGTAAYPVVADPCWSCVVDAVANAAGVVLTVAALVGACPVACTIGAAFAVGWTFGRWVQSNYRSCDDVNTRNQRYAARKVPRLYKFPGPWRRAYYGCRGWRVAPPGYA